MEDKILTIPAVALRGMTILPGMVAHFDISRDKSLRAVEEAMKGDQKLFIVTQKDTEKEDPQGEDLYEVGLLAVVRQVVKLQKNIMRVLIEGIGRAETYEYTIGKKKYKTKELTIETNKVYSTQGEKTYDDWDN